MLAPSHRHDDRRPHGQRRGPPGRHGGARLSHGPTERRREALDLEFAKLYGDAADGLVPGARAGRPDGQPHRLQRRLRGHHDGRPRHLDRRPAAGRPSRAHRLAEPGRHGRLQPRCHRARPRCALDRLRARRGQGAARRTAPTSPASTACCTAPCPSAAASRRRRPSRWPRCWPSGRVSGIELEPLELAILGQRVENEFVGVSCGILDQYTSVLGTAGHALLLDCRALTSRAGQHRARAGGRHLRHARAASAGRQRVRRAAGPVRGRRGPHRAATTPGVTALRDVSLELFEAHEAEAAGGGGQALPLHHRGEPARARPGRCRCRAATRDALAAPVRGLVRRAPRGCSRSVPPSMTAMHEAMDGAPGLIARRQAGAGFGGCLVAIVERESVEPSSGPRGARLRRRHRHRAEHLRRRGCPRRRPHRGRLTGEPALLVYAWRAVARRGSRTSARRRAARLDGPPDLRGGLLAPAAGSKVKGAPKRTRTREAPRCRGNHGPLGRIWCAPSMLGGHDRGTRRLVASRPMPSRMGSMRPSAERVPSGKMMTLKPSFTRSATRSSEARMSDERPNGMAPRSSSVGGPSGLPSNQTSAAAAMAHRSRIRGGSAARTTGASRWLVWLGQMSTGPSSPCEVLADPRPRGRATMPDGPADQTSRRAADAASRAGRREGPARRRRRRRLTLRADHQRVQRLDVDARPAISSSESGRVEGLVECAAQASPRSASPAPARPAWWSRR